MLLSRTGRWFFSVSIFLASVLVILSSTAYAAKVTLDYMVLGYAQEYDAMIRVVEEFEKENPDIDIQASRPTGDYYQTLLVRLASGTTPDITRIVIEQFQGLAIKGAFLDITPYVEKLLASDPAFAKQWNDYIPVLLTAFRYNGRLYGLPSDWNNTLIFYNTRLFDEAGIAYPPENWTVEDFVNIARKLTRKNAKGVEQWGYVTGPDAVFVNLAPWVYTFGGKILSDDWTRVELNRSEGINGLRFMQDLIHRYQVMPTVEELASGGPLFINERVAMAHDGRWGVPGIRAGNPKLSFDVQHQPIGPTGVRGVPFGAASLSISRTTKHPEEALKFVAFVTGPKGQKILNELGSSLPVLSSVVASPEFRNPTEPPKSLVRFIEAAKYSRLIPSPPNFAKLAPVIGGELLKMARGEQSPAQTALNIQTQGDIILKEPVK